MKKKYLLILLVTLLTSMCFVMPTKAVAKYYCTYSTTSKDINVKFRLYMAKNGKINSEDAILTGNDVVGKKDSEGVINWVSAYNGFSGQSYYEKNKKCPSKAILVHRKGKLGFWTYRFYVSDNTNVNKMLDSLKKEFSTQKSGFPVVFDLIEQTEESEEETPSSCLEFNDKGTCENNKYFACVWNKENGYCNVDKLQYVNCGNAYDIPKDAPALTSFFVNLLKIVTPIILIVTSMITLLKALAASKEDEIKKAKSSLLKKIIASVMVFFVISIVQFVILKVADSSEAENISSCMSCFLNNDCSANTYYKTTVSGVDICTNLYGEDVKCSK